MNQEVFTLKQIWRLRILYGFALSFIAFALLSSSIVMHYAIQRNSGDARVINLAGRQRMLSQRITKCALALTIQGNCKPSDLHMKELEESFRVWRQAHLGLQYGDETLGLPRRQHSVETIELFSQINGYYQEMVRAANILISAIHDKTATASSSRVIVSGAAMSLLDNEALFLPLMDRITFVFDKESRERIGQLQIIETIVLALGLGILLFEFLVIFRPSLRKLVKTVQVLVENQNEQKMQLDRAAKYVQALLPPPIFPGNLCVDWRHIPTAELGGDMLGYHWIDKDHFAIYLIDVSDHGIGPALLSVSVINSLRTQALHETDFCQPSQVIHALNKIYPSDQHDDLYFTLWYGVFNRITNEICFSSAGHPQAILLEKSGKISSLSGGGSPVGLFPDIIIEENCIQLQAPAELYIFSDGCFEMSRPDGTVWTAKDFMEFLAKAHHNNGLELDNIVESLKKIHNRTVFDDDFTLIKIGFS